MGVLIDLTGQRFERLLVLSRAPNHGTALYWHTVCDCGERRIVGGVNLRNKRTRSCGCIRKGNSRKIPGESPWVLRVHAEYARGAAVRSLPFNLTYKQVKAFCLADCFYCGMAPSIANSRTMYRNSTQEHEAVNGIDRHDNNSGYSIENCVSCCTTCNHMKLTMQAEAFIKHAARITAHANR